MSRTPQLFGGNVIVLGDFNPAVFSPQWLERNNLIGPDDAKAALESDNLVVTRRGAQVITDGFTLQVTPNQMAVQNTEALTPLVRDLAAGALSILSHTPVRALGINYMAHYRMESLSEWHCIGDTFAPKDIWYDLFPAEKHNAGLEDLKVRIDYCKRGEVPETGDRKIVTIQPSNKIINGVYFQFNDHREVSASAISTAAEVAAVMIRDHWQQVWDEALGVFEQLLEASLDRKRTRTT